MDSIVVMEAQLSAIESVFCGIQTSALLYSYSNPHLRGYWDLHTKTAVNITSGSLLFTFLIGRLDEILSIAVRLTDIAQNLTFILQHFVNNSTINKYYDGEVIRTIFIHSLKLACQKTCSLATISGWFVWMIGRHTFHEVISIYRMNRFL